MTQKSTIVRNSSGLLCNAPFTSMRFNLSGKITACCFNREYPIGEYPHSTLLDIWFGERADRLRNEIKNKNLGLGCFYCQNQIETGDLENLKAKMYDHLSVSEKAFPKLLEFELENTCNLECVMCTGHNSSSIRRNREGLTPIEMVYDQEFINQLSAFIPHLKQATFVGGEPFLINQYYQIWKLISEKNPSISLNVTTNGTVLNDKVKQALDGGFFDLNVSIESIRPNSLEKIRVNSNGLRLLENIEYFIDYTRNRGSQICVWVCPIRENWKEIPEIIEYFNNRDVPIFLHTVWFPPKRALWNLPNYQLLDMLDYYSNWKLADQSPIEVKNKEQFDNYRQLLSGWSEREPPESNQTFEELVSGYLNKIKEYVLSQTTFDDAERNRKWSEYEQKLKHYIENETSERIREVFALLDQYPTERVIGEFELWNKEELRHRINTIA